MGEKESGSGRTGVTPVQGAASQGAARGGPWRASAAAGKRLVTHSLFHQATSHICGLLVQLQ